MKNPQISVFVQSSLSTCEQETCLGDIGNMSGESDGNNFPETQSK